MYSFGIGKISNFASLGRLILIAVSVFFQYPAQNSVRTDREIGAIGKVLRSLAWQQSAN